MDPPRFRVRDALLLCVVLVALVPLTVCWWIWPPEGGPFGER